MIVENGVQLRHLLGITSNFGIIDRMEYMATVVMEEKKPLWHAIVSNAKTFVEGQQSVFDALWSKASLAEQRIRDIEEGLKPAFIETISNPSEIQNLAFDLVKSAKEEIMIIFSTANAFDTRYDSFMAGSAARYIEKRLSVIIRRTKTPYEATFTYIDNLIDFIYYNECLLEYGTKRLYYFNRRSGSINFRDSHFYIVGCAFRRYNHT